MGEKTNKNKLVRTKNGRFTKKETAQNSGESYVEVLRENFKNPVGRPPKDAERQRTDLSIVDTRKASSRQTRKMLMQAAPDIIGKAIDKALLDNDDRFLHQLVQLVAPKDIHAPNTSDYDIRRTNRVAQLLHETMLNNPTLAKNVGEITLAMNRLEKLDKTPTLNEIMIATETTENLSTRTEYLRAKQREKPVDPYELFPEKNRLKTTYIEHLQEEIEALEGTSSELYIDSEKIEDMFTSLEQLIEKEKKSRKLYSPSQKRETELQEYLTEWKEKHHKDEYQYYHILWEYEADRTTEKTLESGKEKITKIIDIHVELAEKELSKIKLENTTKRKELDEAELNVDLTVTELNRKMRFTNEPETNTQEETKNNEKKKPKKYKRKAVEPLQQ